MKYRYDPSVRSFQQPLGGQGQGPQNIGNSPFPGISDPFLGMNKSVGMKTPVPFDTSEFSSGVPAITIQPASTNPIIPLPESNSSALSTITAPAEAEAKTEKSEKGGFNLANSLNDIKGVVDRLGGLDGIVTTMGKVQKVVGSITQMAPLIKVLAGSFGKKGDSASIADDGDGLARPRPRKRKRRKTASGKSVPLNGTKRKQRPRR
ncbi:hypothetical protein GXP70_04665 [Paenibacillus lycopersici]|uniref:Tyrosine protein kinase n=1 Tax=Paenibacillus lycopersici TaxID=2704462 RepID=A0A6C0FV29_9BACL|nr:hypothetical protein [Paenibacillus lycopersici]QHT59331.1 hypothetical protein GXP70_04665 [Paenibacillus lycopersici]